MLIDVEQVCDEDEWIPAASAYINTLIEKSFHSFRNVCLILHNIMNVTKSEFILFFIFLGQCLAVFWIKHSNRTEDNLQVRKRMTTKDTNLQPRWQRCLSNRGPHTNNQVMIPVLTLSSVLLSSLLQNPCATFFVRVENYRFSVPE